MARGFLLRAIFGHYGNSAATQRALAESLEVGDRFYRVSHGASVWEVKCIYVPAGETVTHAIIEEVASPHDSRLISVNALVDATTFLIDRRDEDNSNPAKKRRRHSDFIQEAWRWGAKKQG